MEPKICLGRVQILSRNEPGPTDDFPRSPSNVPIGIIYISYIQANGLVNMWEWVLAIVYMSIALFLTFYIIKQRLLGGENSLYSFDEGELKRLEVE